jgi:hypothetical protein
LVEAELLKFEVEETDLAENTIPGIFKSRNVDKKTNVEKSTNKDGPKKQESE